MKTLKKILLKLKSWFSRKSDLEFERFQNLESKKYQKRGGPYEK